MRRFTDDDNDAYTHAVMHLLLLVRSSSETSKQPGAMGEAAEKRDSVRPREYLNGLASGNCEKQKGKFVNNMRREDGEGLGTNVNQPTGKAIDV